MRRIELILHQLDTAIAEMRSNTPVRARLAAILIDNAVELMLHQEAESALNKWKLLHSGPTPKAAQKALGDRFDPKVGYAVDEKLLSEDQARFVREAHKFRCEAYHVGRLHEKVMKEIVHEYFAIACDLIRHRSQSGYRQRIGSEVPDVIAKYAGTDDAPSGLDRMLAPLRFSQIADRLLAARPSATRPLPFALALALNERIEHLELGLRTLLKAEPELNSMDDLIFRLDAQAVFYSCAPEGGFAYRAATDGRVELDPAHETALANARAAMRTWKPSASTRKIHQWKDRVGKLGMRCDVGALLQAYRRLSDEITPFEDTVLAAWSSYESAVEDAVELARLRRL